MVLAVRLRTVVAVAVAAALLAAGAARADTLEITPDNGLLASAKAQAALLDARLGFPLRLHLAVGWADVPSAIPHASTGVRDKENGDYAQHGPVCQIAVNKAWLAAQPQPTAEAEVLVHEVFHCYEHQIEPDISTPDNHLNEHNWILEGLARWVDLTLYPSTPVAEATVALKQYVGNPSTALFSRAYDAVGFWGHLEDVTGALWSRIPAIIKLGAGFHDANAFNGAVGPEKTDVLDSWGSSAFMLSGGPPEWRTDSPLNGSLGASYPAATPTPVYGPAGVVLKPYTTAQMEIHPRSDLPLIQIHLDDGVYARFGEHANYVDSAVSDKVYCAGSDCSSPAASCPGGTVSKLPRLTPLPAEPTLGLATAGKGGAADVSYFAAQNSALCPQPKSSTGGTASTGGDPHLISFGLTALDFQGVGEFTLVKSKTTGDLEAQVRQQAIPHPLIANQQVAYNSAVAMRVGKAVVELDITNGLSLMVLVNHHPTHSTHASLSGGGSLQITYKTERPAVAGLRLETATIRWHDGTTLTAQSLVGLRARGRYQPWLDVTIKLAHARIGHVTGLLGDAGASPSDQFSDRSGKHYDAAKLLSGAFGGDDAKLLYGEFGGSWRVSQRDSLFTYARGKSTKSYTDTDFPKFSSSVATLTATQTFNAAATCQATGATNRAVLQDCEYDTAVTGDTHHAAEDASLQSITGPGPPLPPPTPNPGIRLGPGSSQPQVSYDPSSHYTYIAWLPSSSAEVVDLCAIAPGGSACNDGAGPYQLTDPTADGGGATPTYAGPQVVVQPGGTVVVVANVYGANSAVEPSGYTVADGVIAWSSVAGGAGFRAPGQGLASGGKLLAEVGNGDYMPARGAVALDATHLETYGNDYPFGSSATDFTLGTPAPRPTPSVDHSGGFGSVLFADGSQVAAIPAPGGQYTVVVVGTSGGGTAGGCPSGTQVSTGYSHATGTPAALQMQATWPAASTWFANISCDAESAVLASAGSTIGVVEAEGQGLSGPGSDGVYFRAFDAPGGTFGAPVELSDETSQTLDGAQGLSAAGDAGGGLWASWADARGVVIDYSASAGSSWQAPRATGIQSTDPVIADAGSGAAEVAYSYQSNEYLDPSP